MILLVKDPVLFIQVGLSLAREELPIGKDLVELLTPEISQIVLEVVAHLDKDVLSIVYPVELSLDLTVECYGHHVAGTHCYVLHFVQHFLVTSGECITHVLDLSSCKFYLLGLTLALQFK